MWRLSHVVMLFCLLTSGMGTAFAATVQLPQTGQTLCYDTNGNVITCSGTGQDGAERMGAPWPSPRFTMNTGAPDNGGSMTDNLTGLIWAKDANIMPSRDPGWDADGIANDGRVTWQHALDYVAKLNAENYLGHADWRLPNINELRSLMHSGYNEETCGEGTCGALNDWLFNKGFGNVQASYYWSSTYYAASGFGFAWWFNMWDGYVQGHFTTNSNNVWPVRGGQAGSLGNLVISKTGQTTVYAAGDDGNLNMGAAWPYPRFTNNGNGTVTDNLTGLVWLKNADCTDTVGGVTKGSSILTWTNALTWSNSLASGLCGLSDGSHSGDWRLPNREEFESLIDFGHAGPALSNSDGTGRWTPGHPFDNVQALYYWSSTSITTGYSTSLAWIIDMWDGGVYYNEKTVSYRVWPVRAGQSGPFGSLTISKSGDGTGTVTSNPVGMSCGTSCSTASAPFPLNHTVILSACPSAGGAIFSSWSGEPDCADGIVTMSADKICTATFNLCNSASIAMTGSSGPFDSINTAFTAAALTDTIRIIASNQEEALDLSGKDLTVQGGYECAFAEPPTSFTTITGSLTISGGSATVGGIKIQ